MKSKNFSKTFNFYEPEEFKFILHKKWHYDDEEEDDQLPLHVGDKTYKHFSGAVKGVMNDKGWTREHAQRYVGGIYQRQERETYKICPVCKGIRGTNPLCYKCTQ